MGIRNLPREVTTVTSGQAIRDTNYWYSSAIDGKFFPQRFVLVRNTLDQPIEVVVEASFDGGTSWKYGGLLAATLSAGTSGSYGPYTAPILNAPVPLWRVRLKSTGTAPTTGNVEVYAIQWVGNMV